MTEKEKIFNETAKKAAKDKGYDLKKINYYSYHMCPDQYICRIEDISNDYFNLTKRKNIFTENTFDIINIPDAENILVTILESSHISEHFEQLSKYKHGDIRKNSVPAIGKYSGDTGSNIVKYIGEIFPNFSNYHLILMNAIPFQCSLGVATRHFRYDVFKKVWTDKNIGDNFFRKRLGNLLNALSGKNVMIVNACTKGCNKGKDRDEIPFLWRLVQNSIETMTLDEKRIIQYFRTNHPSSWSRNIKNREIKEERSIIFHKTEK